MLNSINSMSFRIGYSHCRIGNDFIENQSHFYLNESVEIYFKIHLKHNSILNAVLHYYMLTLFGII